MARGIDAAVGGAASSVIAANAVAVNIKVFTATLEKGKAHLVTRKRIE